MSFGIRDLALLLPDKAADIHSLRHTEEETGKLEVFQPTIDTSKTVKRYFRGKAPEYANNEFSNVVDKVTDVKISDIISAAPTDRRLARLERGNSSTSSSSAHPPPATMATAFDRRRRIYEAEVVADVLTNGYDSNEGDGRFEGVGEDVYDDDDFGAGGHARPNEGRDYDGIERKTMASMSRRCIFSRPVEAEVVINDEDEDESSEYETDSDEEEEDEPILKPVFVPKHKRENAQSVVEEEAAANRERRVVLLAEQRKEETRVMVAETLHRAELELVEGVRTDHADSIAGLPDDTDDLDEEVEFQAWRLREIARLKRDAEQREARALEKADLERRRNMTNEERMEEDRVAGRGAFEVKEKKKWRFMQKYYHKGVFYMDEDSVNVSKVSAKAADVRLRDYSEPTLEDKFNKESLPSVLQVKKFGMRGRTKYTHLADQDTTQFVNPIAPKALLAKSGYLNKRAGVGEIDNAFKRRKS